MRKEGRNEGKEGEEREGWSGERKRRLNIRIPMGENNDTCTHLVKLLQEMETSCAGEVAQGSIRSRTSKQMQQILLLLNNLYIR